MANRTSKGNVTAEAREKHGDEKGRFPIFDTRSALSALKLRGHANSKAERRSIINRARKYAPKAASEAYQKDKAAGLI
jgi:hypothetical protein